MFVAEEKWQTTRANIRERTKFIHKNDFFSDVKFAVRESDDESESKPGFTLEDHLGVIWRLKKMVPGKWCRLLAGKLNKKLCSFTS